MGITKLPKAATPTGRTVQRVVRNLRPRTPVGKIVVALTAEIGGAIGDRAHRAFVAGAGSRPAEVGAGEWVDERLLREERVRRYAAEALREQHEAGGRAEEAFRQARDQTRRGEESGPRRTDTREGRGRRYKGKPVTDYYELLEVSPKARPSIIEKAYRALMREDHPDQGGDTERAQLINEAYQVLHDPARRREYDEENGLR
jgi:hypothetical protein